MSQKRCSQLGHWWKEKEMRYQEILEACWSGYQKQGMKKKGDRMVPNCVPVSEQELEEDLRKWFKEKWVRFGPDGKIRGDCARGSKGEGKPKCLPQAKAHALGKKGRASAAARKRRQDPDADRKGAAKNVPTKESADLEEGWKEKMAAAAVAGGLALGAGSAQALDVDKYGMAKDVFGPSQDYAVHQPLKSIAVDMPNQWVKSKNVIVYDKMIFNPMSAEMYGKIKSSQAYKRDGEIVPAGTVPGVDGNIMLYTEGDYNYFLTGKMAKNYSQELATTDLVNRNLSTAQRYVQGDLKKSTAPKIQNFNPDISKKPTMPWQRNQDKNT